MNWKNIGLRMQDEISKLESLEPHEVLGVPADAAIEDIKKAYRHLVKVYHPDKADPFMKEYNEQVLRIINESYSTLFSRHNRIQ